MADTTTTTDTAATTSKDDEKNSNADVKESGTPAAKATETPETRFSQAEVSRIVKKELDAERNKWKKSAEESAAQQNGEFEKLATNYKMDLDRLTAQHDELVQNHEALVEKVQALVKAEMKSLPDMVRDLAPSEDPVALIEWLPKAKKSAESLVVNGKPSEKGNDRGPKPASVGTDGDVKSIKDSMRSRGRYTGF